MSSVLGKSLAGRKGSAHSKCGPVAQQHASQRQKGHLLQQCRREKVAVTATTALLPKHTPDALTPPMTQMVLPSFLFRSHCLPLHIDADTAGKAAHDHAGCAAPGRG